jgi:hypothetical protein
MKRMNPITQNCHWQKNWMFSRELNKRGWWVHKASKVFRTSESKSERHSFRKRLMMACCNKHRSAQIRFEQLQRNGDGKIAYKSPELLSPKNPEWY